MDLEEDHGLFGPGPFLEEPSQAGKGGENVVPPGVNLLAECLEAPLLQKGKKVFLHALFAGTVVAQRGIGAVDADQVEKELP